jgi:hypothetical protein
MQWYAMMGTKTFGPLDGDTIAEWLRTGALNAHAFVRDEASGWMPIAQSPFAAFVPGGAQVVVPAVAAGGEGLGTLIVLVPFLSTLLIWFWVGSMNLLQDPGGTLLMLSVITILGTALLIAVEASQLGMGKRLGSNGRGESGPIGWFIACALLWIVGYPWYLHKRKYFGRRSHLLAGIFFAGLFTFSTFSMGMAIEGRKAELRTKLGGFSGLAR